MIYWRCALQILPDCEFISVILLEDAFDAPFFRSEISWMNELMFLMSFLIRMQTSILGTRDMLNILIPSCMKKL